MFEFGQVLRIRSTWQYATPRYSHLRILYLGENEENACSITLVGMAGTVLSPNENVWGEFGHFNNGMNEDAFEVDTEWSNQS